MDVGGLMLVSFFRWFGVGGQSCCNYPASTLLTVAFGTSHHIQSLEPSGFDTSIWDLTPLYFSTRPLWGMGPRTLKGLDPLIQEMESKIHDRYGFELKCLQTDLCVPPGESEGTQNQQSPSPIIEPLVRNPYKFIPTPLQVETATKQGPILQIAIKKARSHIRGSWEIPSMLWNVGPCICDFRSPEMLPTVSAEEL